MSEKPPESILVVTADIAKEALKATYDGKPGVPQCLDGFHACENDGGDYVRQFLGSRASFADREPMESDPTHKQLIVYALVSYQDQILCYKRGKVGQEPRLHAKRSVGVGGHINPDDWPVDVDGLEAFNTALLRELEEEVGITAGHVAGAEFLGLVNEDETEVGKAHLGLVFFVRLDHIADLKFEDAFVDPLWYSPAAMVAEEGFELWSALVRNKLFPIEEKVAAPDDYQSRVILEKGSLDERLARLTPFLKTDKFNGLPAAEQERMIRQHHHMTEYSKVLGERIAAF